MGDGSFEYDSEDIENEDLYPPYGRERYGPPPRSPTWNDRQTHYGYPPQPIVYRMSRELWDPPLPYHGSSELTLGDEILGHLRVSRGGIYYTKSSPLKQVHYIDHYPFYTCALVPSSMIPQNEWKPLHTELGQGLVRKEALDLLGYSYTETEGGKFSVLGNLEMVRSGASLIDSTDIRTDRN